MEENTLILTAEAIEAEWDKYTFERAPELTPLGWRWYDAIFRDLDGVECYVKNHLADLTMDTPNLAEIAANGHEVAQELYATHLRDIAILEKHVELLKVYSEASRQEAMQEFSRAR